VPRSVVFHPVAREELRAAVATYETERAGLGIALAKQLRELTSIALAFPSMGAPYTVPGVRRLFARDFPYALAYLVADDRIDIVAVIHLRREPGYWHDRLAPTGPV